MTCCRCPPLHRINYRIDVCDMIQFQDGKWNVGVALCHGFQVFTIIQLEQIYRSRACVVNTGEAHFQTKQILHEETTSGTFHPGCQQENKHLEMSRKASNKGEERARDWNTHGCQTKSGSSPAARSLGLLKLHRQPTREERPLTRCSYQWQNASRNNSISILLLCSPLCVWWS